MSDEAESRVLRFRPDKVGAGETPSTARSAPTSRPTSTRSSEGPDGPAPTTVARWIAALQAPGYPLPAGCCASGSPSEHDLEDSLPGIRRRAAWLLGKVVAVPGRAVPALLRRLEDPSPEVEAEAAAELGGFAPFRAQEVHAALVERLLSYQDANEVDAALLGSLWRYGVCLEPGEASAAVEEAEVACRRFWRGDAARSEATRHCGLGLALVERATEALGGGSGSAERGGEFAVAVTLPAPGSARDVTGDPTLA